MNKLLLLQYYYKSIILLGIYKFFLSVVRLYLLKNVIARYFVIDMFLS